MAKKRLSIEALKRALDYDTETGILIWRQRVGARVFAGMEAGSVDGQGYKHFQYLGVVYPCHQVAWAFAHGQWPALGIDHWDGNRSNNRLSNLREATSQQNNANRRLSKNNKSGAKGVRWHRGKWEAAIGFKCEDGTYALRHLICTDDFDLAVLIYQEAADKMHGQFSWGGKN